VEWATIERRGGACGMSEKIKNRRRSQMGNSFMRVNDVAAELGISKSYAYKIVRKLNTELKNTGYLIVAGRVSKKYFMEKVCYGEHDNKERK
jgi:hypothetical protein